MSAGSMNIWSGRFVAVVVSASLAVTLVAQPASADDPTPAPSPSAAAEPVVEPEAPVGETSGVTPADEQGASEADSAAAESQVPVEGQDVAPVDQPETLSVGDIYGADTFVAPPPSAETALVQREDAFDAQLQARDAEAGSSGDSVFVGAGVAPLGDLAADLYGYEFALETSRPDLIAEELPRAQAGDELQVDVTPMLTAGTIPGAAFAAELRFEYQFDASWVDAAFDVSGFENAYGANYGQRLQLVALPECALTTPEVDGCLVGVALETTHQGEGYLRAFVPAGALSVIDVQGQMGATHLVDVGTGALLDDVSTANWLGTAAPTGKTIVAAISGASSQAGTFKATDLAPSGTWGVAEPAGAFTYAIPISVPPTSAGAAPSVALTYSSQTTDGKTAASNSQSGLIGEGWSMPVSYIERLYKTCADDGGTSQQQCWDSPYTYHPQEAAYVLSLQGKVEELVFQYDATMPTNKATYVAASDPTLKVTRYFGTAGRGGNGDDNGEYFKVETNDGSVYYFGYGPHGAGSDNQSVAYQPVPGNQSGEPGYTNAVGVIDNQAYRFYLDLAVDASSNATTYYYRQYLNSYSANGVKKPYVRDTELVRIEYGQRFDSVAKTVTAGEARVDFNVIGRCVELGQFYDSLNPPAGAPTACPDLDIANASSYPDVPVDLLCGTGTCNATQNSPTYFSAVRLNNVATSYYDSSISGGTWVPVDTTQLITAFPTTADGSARSLWLDSVYTHAYGAFNVSGDDVDTYLTKFGGIRLNNRVDWKLNVGPTEQALLPLDRMRIEHVWTDLGARIDVTYAREGAAASTPTANLDGKVCPQTGQDATTQWSAWLAANPVSTINSAANTKLCFAIKAGESTALYHTYVVTGVDLIDLVGDQPAEHHTYVYNGNPAYARTDSVLYSTSAQASRSTFSSYLGFGSVTSWVGPEASAAKTTSQFFRGVGGTLTSLYKEADGIAITVSDGDLRYQGSLESSATVDAAGNTVSMTRPQYELYVPGVTLTWERTDLPVNHKPHELRSKGSTTRTIDGTWWSKTVTSATFAGPQGLPTEILSTTTDSRFTPQSEVSCQKIEYASSTTVYLTVAVAATAYEGGCGTTGSIVTGQVKVAYDGAPTPGATNQNPSRGLVTQERTYTTLSDYVTSKATYDTMGRFTAAWLPTVAETQGAAASVTWTYPTDTERFGPLWKTTVTQALGAVSETWTERSHGNTVKTHGATSRDYTHYQYDALGLLVAAWAPTQWGQDSAPSLATVYPTVLYRYDIYATGPTLRSTPAVITTAPYVKFTGTDYVGAPGAGTTRRSMVFLDGFGRAIEQHALAPNGTGKAVVTATRYNELGQVDWTSAPFVSTHELQVLTDEGTTNLVNPSLQDLSPGNGVVDNDFTATDYTYDSLGRTVATSSLYLGAIIQVGGTSVTSSTSYAGPATTTTAPDGSSTTVTVDTLGRPMTQVANAPVAMRSAPGYQPQTTQYAYQTMTTAALASDTLQVPAGIVTLTSAQRVGSQRVTVTDPDGRATVFESNLAGQRTLMVDPNAGATGYGYTLNGNTATVRSAVGTISMTYDALGRLTKRESTNNDQNLTASSSATWRYVLPGDATASEDLGLLIETIATTRVPGGPAFETKQTTDYDALHRPVSSTTKLPVTTLLGDLSGDEFTIKFSDAAQTPGSGYDALGQPIRQTLPALGALPEETVTTGYRLSGAAQTLTVSSGSGENARSTDLVTGVSFSGTGQLLSRTYGNGVVRSYSWHADTRALTGITARFRDLTAMPDAEGTYPWYDVQNESFVRDVMGRITQSTNEVPVSVDPDGEGSAPAVDQVTAECFQYDGFNRLAAAWTVADASAPVCGTQAPVSVTAPGGDASSTGYAQAWSYSLGGRIESLTERGAAGFATQAFDYDDEAHPAAVTSTTGGADPGVFTYDSAGRMKTRNVTGLANTTLTWDVSSSLVKTDGQGGVTYYVYDASGQRVAQARAADAGGAGGTATAYVGGGQVEDPNTAVADPSALVGTRYYAFGGATVAIRTAPGPGGLSLLLGDEQGSTSVMMPVHLDEATGAMLAATVADAAGSTRTAYTPFGELRGGPTADNLATDRGWLGQVEDRVVVTGASSTGTGLTYLNARYYDPATMRFISPDPLMNPGDPKTLDPYRYADNNPVVFTDASGLSPVVPKPHCGNLSGYAHSACYSAAMSAINLEAKYAAGWAYWEGEENYQKTFSNNRLLRGWQQAVDSAIVTPVNALISDPWGTIKSTATQNAKACLWGGCGIGLLIQAGIGIGKGATAAYQQGGLLQAAGFIQGSSAIAYVSYKAPAMAAEGVAAALPKPGTVAAPTPPTGASTATPTIRNASLAGDVHPTTGVPFDADGFPNFSAFRHPDVPDVTIVPTGTRAGDFAAANRAAGLSETPAGYTWHHHQEVGLMQLIDRSAHAATGHTGGYAIWGNVG